MTVSLCADRARSAYWWFGLLVLVALLVSACSSDDAPASPDAGDTATAVTTATAAQDSAAPALDAVQVAGQPVKTFFAQNCAACHGMRREGLVGPALTPDRLMEDDAFYADVITNGRPGTAMTSWSSTLDTDEIDILVHWLKTDPGGN